MSGRMSGGEGVSFDPKDVQSFLVLILGAVLFVLFFLVFIPSATRWGLEPNVEDQPQVPEAGWLDIAEAPAEPGKDIPPVDPAEVMNPTGAMLARGKELFGPNCASCHGGRGRGDGPAASALKPPPRDFASAAGWKNGPGLVGILKTLSEGIPGSSMSAFDTLPPKDRMALVHFVRSLGTFDHGLEDPAALEAMAEKFRSSGGRIPNRIPTRVAGEKLMGEADPVPPLRAPSPDEPGEGAALARRVVLDGARAAQTLAGAPGWEGDEDLFARVAVAGAPADGFSASSASLTGAQWKSLHAYLAGEQR